MSLALFGLMAVIGALSGVTAAILVPAARYGRLRSYAASVALSLAIGFVVYAWALALR